MRQDNCIFNALSLSRLSTSPPPDRFKPHLPRIDLTVVLIERCPGPAYGMIPCPLRTVPKSPIYQERSFSFLRRRISNNQINVLMYRPDRTSARLSCDKKQIQRVHPIDKSVTTRLLLWCTNVIMSHPIWRTVFTGLALTLYLTDAIERSSVSSSTFTKLEEPDSRKIDDNEMEETFRGSSAISCALRCVREQNCKVIDFDKTMNYCRLRRKIVKAKNERFVTMKKVSFKLII